MIKPWTVTITDKQIDVSGFTFDAPLGQSRIEALSWALNRIREALSALSQEGKQ